MQKKENSEQIFKETFSQRINLAISTNDPITWDFDLTLPILSQNQNQNQNQTQTQTQTQTQKEIKVFTADESRFGLMTILRRRITLKGVKPVVKFQQSFENTYLYGAVEPKTGDSFFFELPRLNTTCFQIFLDELSLAFPHSLNILVLDNGSFHKADKLKLPSNIRLLFTPPYTPEVNPIERVWLSFKSILADYIFSSIDQLSERLSSIISSCSSSEFSSLTFFPFFKSAINALS